MMTTVMVAMVDYLGEMPVGRVLSLLEERFLVSWNSLPDENLGSDRLGLLNGGD